MTWEDLSGEVAELFGGLNELNAWKYQEKVLRAYHFKHQDDRESRYLTCPRPGCSDPRADNKHLCDKHSAEAAKVAHAKWVSKMTRSNRCRDCGGDMGTPRGGELGMGTVQRIGDRWGARLPARYGRKRVGRYDTRSEAAHALEKILGDMGHDPGFTRCDKCRARRRVAA